MGINPKNQHQIDIDMLDPGFYSLKIGFIFFCFTFIYVCILHRCVCLLDCDVKCTF